MRLSIQIIDEFITNDPIPLQRNEMPMCELFAGSEPWNEMPTINDDTIKMRMSIRYHVGDAHCFTVSMLLPMTFPSECDTNP
jgi:hypothetical protein